LSYQVNFYILSAVWRSPALFFMSVVMIYLAVLPWLFFFFGFLSVSHLILYAIYLFTFRKSIMSGQRKRPVFLRLSYFIILICCHTPLTPLFILAPIIVSLYLMVLIIFGYKDLKAV
jgi:hypothetical protein